MVADTKICVCSWIKEQRTTNVSITAFCEQLSSEELKTERGETDSFWQHTDRGGRVER